MPAHPYGAFPGAGPGPQRSPYYAAPYGNHPSQPFHQYPSYPYHQQPYGPQPSHYVGANNAMDVPPYGPPPPGPIPPSGPPIHPSDVDETKSKS